MSTYVLGLDVSLTSTGIAAIDVATGALDTTVAGSSGSAQDTYGEHMQRHIGLCDSILEQVGRADPALVVIESASFTTPKDTSAHRRAGLWWRVYEQVGEHWPVVTVTPAEVKKYATGKGNAGKEKVLAQTILAYGVDPLPTAMSDRADAAVMASIGSDYLGGAVGFDRTAYRDAVLDKLSQGREWPQVAGPRRYRNIALGE